MESSYYAMVFRMKYINRWVLMRNMSPETLSEHSLQTAMIAHCLAIIGKRRLKKPTDPDKVLAAALFHDTAEVLTGDLPTPVKYYNNEIKSAYKKIESVAEQKLLSLLPSDLADDFADIYSPDEETKKYVKAADKLSAYLKCKEELLLNNKEFAVAEQTTLSAIKNMNMPEAEMFLKEFLPAFEQPLDNSIDR